MVLTNRDEFIWKYFKSALSYSEILSVLSVHHNVSLSTQQLKTSINNVLAFVINELEFSSRYLGYRAMHQKLLMNGLIIDQESVHLILKERDPLGGERRGWHSLTKCTYISTGANYIWHIDGYEKIKPFGFAIHGAIDGYCWKILWLFVGSSNNYPKIIAYYFINCIVDLQLVILQLLLLLLLFLLLITYY